MSAVSSAPARSTAGRYGAVAIVLHWLLGAGIVGAFALGLYMADLPFSPTRLKLYNWHKWAGVTILALSAVRLLWRLANRPPALSAQVLSAMPAWQQKAHHGTHHLMYLLFFAVPLTGWAYSSAAGFPIVWFGVLPLPDFVPVSKELADAIKHQVIDRDRLLGRMGIGPA
jgi:cytochrome b561